jgi:hypothetical protein
MYRKTTLKLPYSPNTRKEVIICRERFSQSITPENCIAPKKFEKPNSGDIFGHIKINFRFLFLGMFNKKNILYAYKENMLNREIYTKSVYISVNSNTDFKNFTFFYLHYVGWIRPKNHLTLCPFESLKFNAKCCNLNVFFTVYYTYLIFGAIYEDFFSPFSDGVPYLPLLASGQLHSGSLSYPPFLSSFLILLSYPIFLSSFLILHSYSPFLSSFLIPFSYPPFFTYFFSCFLLFFSFTLLLSCFYFAFFA